MITSRLFRTHGFDNVHYRNHCGHNSLVYYTHDFLRFVYFHCGAFRCIISNKRGDNMPYVKANPDMRKKGDKVKSEWIKVRVSKAEFETIRKVSENAGISISELIRTRVLGG